jgi:hypothetical protein
VDENDVVMSSKPLSQCLVRSFRAARTSTQCSSAAFSSALRQPSVRRIHQISGSRIRPSSRSPTVLPSLGPRTSKRTIFIQTEDTPNADVRFMLSNLGQYPEHQLIVHRRSNSNLTKESFLRTFHRRISNISLHDPLSLRPIHRNWLRSC